MEVINLEEKKLKKMELSKKVLNVEAEFFRYSQKKNWHFEEYVFKKFFHTTGTVYGNKLFTINALIDHKDEIDMEQLVMPEALGAIDGQMVGVISPFIENINLQDILSAKLIDFSLKYKIAYLKEIGEILEKMKKMRKYSSVKDFYLNDIHESNFILNTKTGKINVVDLDSAKINNNLTFPSKYLNPISPLYDSPKYKLAKNDIGGYFEINDNTELYCYTMMILNFFYGANASMLTIPDFYAYLDYLNLIGVPKHIVDSLACLFINKDNVNISSYLEELEPFYYKMNKIMFKERVRIKP